MKTWYGSVPEDGSFYILSRLAALEGTGSEYVAGEGNVLKQADVSTITCKVYSLGTNKDNESGTEVTPAPTLTAAANLFDTLRTVGWPTGDDCYGYNFRHDVGPTYVPNPEEWYLLEYKITLTGGGVVWMSVKVKTGRITT